MNYNNISHANFAKGFRGGERQTLLLIKELSSKGHQQTIFTRKNSDLAKRLVGIDNLTIFQISKPYIFSISKIPSSTIIHAHETKAAQFAYFTHLFTKVPYIITRRVVNPIKNNFLNKLIYNNSRYTITLSKAIKDEVLKLTKNVKIKIIPDAYSQLNYNEQESENLQKRFQDKFIIGSIGELDNDTKGQQYLIEALQLLQKNYKDMHLILLGKGKDLEHYRELTRDMNNVSIEGFVDNIGDYIKLFNLFVFPSIKEGLGSSLLDVMNFNVPIIASDTGGIPDLIQHENNGLLVEPRSTQAIYNAILQLYNNKQEADKYVHNAKNNLENYHISTIASLYEECYNINSL